MSLDRQREPATAVFARDTDDDWSEQLKRAYGFRVIDQEGTEVGEVEDFFRQTSDGASPVSALGVGRYPWLR